MTDNAGNTEYGIKLKRLLNGMSRKGKSNHWWAWHGDHLVETLSNFSKRGMPENLSMGQKQKDLSKGGISLFEAIAYASGKIKKQDNGLIVEEGFAVGLAAKALDDPDAYVLAMKVCSINLSADCNIPESLRTIAAASLLKTIDHPVKRGRSRTVNWERDILILRGLLIAENIGLPISKGSGSQNICGVSLVCEAFKKAGKKWDWVTVEAIEQVWKKRKKSGLESDLHEMDFAFSKLQTPEVFNLDS